MVPRDKEIHAIGVSVFPTALCVCVVVASAAISFVLWMPLRVISVAEI